MPFFLTCMINQAASDEPANLVEDLLSWYDSKLFMKEPSTDKF